jgi:hypothetical protein
MPSIGGGTLIVNEIYRLSELEEVLGGLHSVEVNDIGLIAVIGKISVWLPNELEEDLKGLVGQRVGILRLDGYHIRCLVEKNAKPNEQREKASA